jgi:hypothetical protein
VTYPYVWRVSVRPIETRDGTRGSRKGERCRVLVWGAKNSVLVEFERDGKRVVTSRNYLATSPTPASRPSAPSTAGARRPG